MAEVLDELPDDARLAEELGHGQDEVGGGGALGQRAGQLEADDLRHEHRERLAEHRRLGLDPADAPAEHAEAVHHRRVRVGADERVGERLAVALLDHAREELEVDLVDDARPGRHDLEVAEALLAPAEEGVALAVALELELDVAREGAARAEDVDLHRVVDHELDRDQRVDLLRVAAEVGHRVPHRREVDDGRDAGEVLEQDARRREGDLAARLVRRHPPRDRFDVVRVAVPEHVLEQDPERVREPRDVPALLQRVQPVDLELAIADGERGAGGNVVGHASNLSNSPRSGRSGHVPGTVPGQVRFASGAVAECGCSSASQKRKKPSWSGPTWCSAMWSKPACSHSLIASSTGFGSGPQGTFSIAISSVTLSATASKSEGRGSSWLIVPPSPLCRQSSKTVCLAFSSSSSQQSRTWP